MSRPAEPGRLAGRAQHGLVRDERTGVGRGAAATRLAGPGGEHDDGLPPRGRASRLDEGAPVRDVLDVHGDRARRVVLGEVQQQVGQRDVGLVADRCEAASPSPNRPSRRPTSSERLPDCEISPTGPAGYSLDEMRRFAAASKIPMQFGPSMSAPAART